MRAAVSRIRMLRTPYNGHSNRVETGRAVVTLAHTHTHAIRRRGVKLSVRVFQRTGRSSREDLDVASSSDRVRRHRRCSVSREIESQPIIGRAKKPTSLSFEFLSDSSLPSCNNARKEAADRACALETFLVPFVDGSKRTRRVCCG